MKRRLALSLPILFLPALAYCQASNSPGPAGTSARVEDEIVETIRQRLASLARRDTKTYLSYFTGDCIVIDDNGAVMKPQDIVKQSAGELQSGVIYRADPPVDFQVQSYGDTAVATFRLNYDEDWAGQKTYSSARLIDVLVRRGGRWLVVSHQETPIPYARRVAAKVDPSVFDAYAGEYQLTPNFIVKVKREGDDLMEQWPGETAYTADVPVSESTFVARGGLGESIYVKDESGRVTHFIFRTASGDVIAKKIK